jgi:hypothetical protein
MAMIAARALQPASKLDIAQLYDATALGQTMGAEDATEDQLHGALDWVVSRRERIEKRLATPHNRCGGALVWRVRFGPVECLI